MNTMVEPVEAKPDTVAVETVRGPIFLTPGLINNNADLAYKNGQCIALAIAIHEQTAWPLVAHLSRPGDLEWEQATHDTNFEDLDADWFKDLVHVLIQTPDGNLLDIAGDHDYDGYRESATDAHGTCALVVVPANELIDQQAEAHTAGHTAPVQNLDVAATFADTILGATGF